MNKKKKFKILYFYILFYNSKIIFIGWVCGSGTRKTQISGLEKNNQICGFGPKKLGF